VSDPRSEWRKICQRIWFIIGALIGLAAIGYGSFLLYHRSHVSCPIPSSVSHHDLRSDPIHVYSSFCNPSLPTANETSLNVTQWCDTLGCGGQPPNDWCLVYITGDPASSCPLSEGGCALRCFPSIAAALTAGTVLVIVGCLILIIETIVSCCQWKRTGDWW